MSRKSKERGNRNQSGKIRNGRRKGISVVWLMLGLLFAAGFAGCGKRADVRELESGLKTGITAEVKEGAGAGTGAEEEETQRPLEGKKLSVCGDSISTFTGYIPDYYSKYYPEMGEITRVEDTWWMQVLERTGMELCRNASYSGSTVSGPSLDEEDGRYSCGNRRIADLCSESGEEPDIILILMGTNDLLMDVPLGAYDGVSAVEEGNIETFSEAYALMLDKMMSRYPEADIYCCTIAAVGRQNEEGENYAFTNIHGVQAKDYNAWIEAVAEAKGLPVIDVYGCGITYENIMEYTTEGTHPNAAGAKMIADIVGEELEADAAEP